MTIKYLKKSPKTSSTDDLKTREIVQNLLSELEKTKEDGCKNLTKKFDKYDGEIEKTVCAFWSQWWATASLVSSWSLPSG